MKKFAFLTDGNCNLFVVAKLYRTVGKIELFFKWLKRHLS